MILNDLYSVNVSKSNCTLILSFTNNSFGFKNFKYGANVKNTKSITDTHYHIVVLSVVMCLSSKAKFK